MNSLKNIIKQFTYFILHRSENFENHKNMELEKVNNNNSSKWAFYSIVSSQNFRENVKGEVKAWGSRSPLHISDSKVFFIS